MNDPFASWKLVQDNLAAAQKAQVEAATRLMGSTASSEGALRAAQQIGEANLKAWQTWMAMWGSRK